jgi:hypothetical protein
MMADALEVIETRIVPVEKPGMMTVEAPNGMLIQAPLEIWMAAVMAQLSDAHQARLCDRVVRMTLEHNGRHGQIIHPYQVSAFDCMHERVKDNS